MPLLPPGPVLAFALALCCALVPCRAQTTPVAEAVAPGSHSEPAVQHTVIEDDGSKIDELRVRGQVQHVVVTPKVGFTRSYEIIVGRSGREPVDGTGGANSAAGKRVWNVLNF
jgi:hypothetical protein